MVCLDYSSGHILVDFHHGHPNDETSIAQEEYGESETELWFGGRIYAEC